MYNRGMEYVFAIVVAVLAFYAFHSPTRTKVKQAADDIVGVCAVALERTSQKERRKAKALELLAKHEEMGNEDIRKALGVSARSVVNYMNELEDEGRAEQIGEAGHAVVYRLSDK